MAKKKILEEKEPEETENTEDLEETEEFELSNRLMFTSTNRNEIYETIVKKVRSSNTIRKQKNKLSEEAIVVLANERTDEVLWFQQKGFQCRYDLIKKGILTYFEENENTIEIKNLTVRHLYYYLVNNSYLYKNNDFYYSAYISTESDLRKKWIIPYDCFVDSYRKLEKNIIFPSFSNSNEEIVESTIDSIKNLTSTLNRLEGQKHLVLILIEKNTIFENIHSGLRDTNYYIGETHGYGSLTSLSKLYKTIRKFSEDHSNNGVPLEVHVLYLGDFDKSGFNIEKASYNNLLDIHTYYERDLPESEKTEFNWTWKRIGLTIEQIFDLNLPNIVGFNYKLDSTGEYITKIKKIKKVETEVNMLKVNNLTIRVGNKIFSKISILPGIEEEKDKKDPNPERLKERLFAIKKHVCSLSVNEQLLLHRVEVDALKNKYLIDLITNESKDYWDHDKEKEILKREIEETKKLKKMMKERLDKYFKEEFYKEESEPKEN